MKIIVTMAKIMAKVLTRIIRSILNMEGRSKGKGNTVEIDIFGDDIYNITYEKEYVDMNRSFQEWEQDWRKFYEEEIK